MKCYLLFILGVPRLHSGITHLHLGVVWGREVGLAKGRAWQDWITSADADQIRCHHMRELPNFPNVFAIQLLASFPPCHLALTAMGPLPRNIRPLRRLHSHLHAKGPSLFDPA